MGIEQRLGEAAAGLACALAIAGCYVGGGVAGQDEEPLAEEESGDDAPDAPSRDDAGDAPDDGPQGTACEGPFVGPSKLARLTQEQYANAIFDLLDVEIDPADLSGDERIGPFDANLASGVGALQLREYLEVAEVVAQGVVAESVVPGCPNDAMLTDCAAQFVHSLAYRAYGRPLTEAQRNSLDAVFAAGLQDGVPTAVSLSVTAILQNPYLLYAVLTGEPDPDEPGILRLDGPSIARRMALLVWGSVADDELLDVADQLWDPAVRREQAERMLSDPRAERAIGRRYAEWFGVADLEARPKDAEVYEGFDAELARDMEQAVERFAARTVVEGGTLDDMLLSRRAFVSPTLAGFYGVAVDGAGASDSVEIELPEDERAGLLTRAAVMTRWAHDDQTSPVHRGVLVRVDVLCHASPPPPPDVSDDPVPIDPDATARERLAEHRVDPTCKPCHERLDLVGFGFEHYDGVGRYRAQDGNVAVDARGELVDADVQGEFEGALELSEMLATSQDVRRCFIRQHVRLSQLREFAAADAPAQCMVDALDEALPASSLSLRDLLVATIAHDTFAQRLIEEEGQ